MISNSTAGVFPMRVHKGHFAGVRVVLAASAVALLGAVPALAAESAQPAASFEPTMADYLGIYDALQHYRIGVETHDQEIENSSRWQDGRGRGGNGGPPPGGGANGGPPGAGGPPGGGVRRGGGAPNFEELRKMPGFVEVWHLPLDSYIHFESATRARHYEYFLSIYPQPEKKLDPAELAKLPDASSYRNSILGWPGHYDDILEKRNGEWRILQRQMGMGTK
jgi:hypothetical protein